MIRASARCSHTRPINPVIEWESGRTFHLSILFYAIPQHILPRSHAQKKDGGGGGEERERAIRNFSPTGDEIWRSRVRARNERKRAGSTISCCVLRTREKCTAGVVLRGATPRHRSLRNDRISWIPLRGIFWFSRRCEQRVVREADVV